MPLSICLFVFSLVVMRKLILIHHHQTLITSEQPVWVLRFNSTKLKALFLSILNPVLSSFDVLYTIDATSLVSFRSTTGDAVSKRLKNTLIETVFLLLNCLLNL
eukprot:TRINITY_DN14593_c0_g1_i4.p1 TRINITY_DN14593_c0_g1~~TRINITY_DN14593_c0_g1_i4.p1  ORF type:complete len:104 (-),score=2.53 TRINITY_DN14593_c0_g1_i4:137-448(-)